MKPIFKPCWDLTPEQAYALQSQLATQVIKTDQFNNIQCIAGVDVAYDQQNNRLFAAVVVLEANRLKVIETTTAEDQVRFPYIPGLFSFRELPALSLALEKLSCPPDLIICDGQGLAHPRRFGLACHLGVLYDVPTIGCGKTRLIGTFETPGSQRGEYVPLIDQGEIIGCVLRTQNGIKPLYISIGHRVSLPTAIDWILRLTPQYRFPETTRQANSKVNQLRWASKRK